MHDNKIFRILVRNNPCESWIFPNFFINQIVIDEKTELTKKQSLPDLFWMKPDFIILDRILKFRPLW